MLAIALAADDRKNLLKLGTSTTTPFQSSYKMRPDYMTQTVFAAERKDVKTYNEL